MISLLSRRSDEPTGRFQSLEQFTPAELRQMYLLYQQYYANTCYELFERDFRKKTGAFLILHPDTGVIVGFSTVLECRIQVGTQHYPAVFSGDTVIDQAFWGCRTLQRCMYQYLMRMKLRYFYQPIYWMLISKGFKTYLLLANNYYSYWPHPSGEHQRLSPIVHAYCEQFFDPYYDRTTGLLNFGADYQPLKQDVAPITDTMQQQNEKIDFFVRKNPTWQQGTELPCIGEIT
ncbi:MAG: hypothetical protein VXW65_04060 [Pseudomonadota bacterium]|nr:hypothetical protein [Pseudomonadota bacterium]